MVTSTGCHGASAVLTMRPLRPVSHVEHQDGRGRMCRDDCAAARKGARASTIVMLAGSSCAMARYAAWRRATKVIGACQTSGATVRALDERHQL
jgi:hypothetical protein